MCEVGVGGCQKKKKKDLNEIALEKIKFVESEMHKASSLNTWQSSLLEHVMYHM